MEDEIIKRYSVVCNIPENLIRAIILKESSWNPWAVRVERGFWTRYLVGIKNLFLKTPSDDDKWLDYPDFVNASYGLMQILLTTAMELGFEFDYPTELCKPELNIKYGCMYLKKLHDKYGNWNDVISAYNQGNNGKNSYGMYKNQAYVDKVKSFMGEVK